jgi:DNA-binding MarR family transcriptional regulator
MSTKLPGPDPSPRSALELELGVELNALLSASRALTERSAAAFHPELQPAAFHIARWLYAYGPAKPSAVAEAVGMDRSSTSHLIGWMKRLGLVESRPDPSDRRAVLLSLSPTGEAQVLAALDLRGAAFSARLRGWSEEDLQTFTALLHRFNAG